MTLPQAADQVRGRPACFQRHEGEAAGKKHQPEAAFDTAEPDASAARNPTLAIGAARPPDVRISETCAVGKYLDGRLCEHIAVIGNRRVAVIDGVTDKSGLTRQRHGRTLTSGRFAAEVIAGTLETLETLDVLDDGARFVIDTLTEALARHLPGLDGRDVGRDLIEPLLRRQWALANTVGEFGYGAIDGTAGPDAYLEVFTVGDDCSEIVLASDDYPTLPGSVAQAETGLARMLSADATCTGILRGTKAPYPGQASFDERSWVRIDVTFPAT